jgi:hypothetical protein
VSTLRLRYSVSRIAWALASLSVLAACQPATYDIQQVIEAESCTDDAVAMQAQVESSGSLSLTFDAASANVVGAPLEIPFGPASLLVAELNSVNTGDKVMLRYNAHITTVGFLSVSVTDIAFYKTPWEEGNPPDCSPADGPAVEVVTDGVYDLHLRIRNPGPLPMMITSLELVESDLLPGSSLDWQDDQFNALPWVPAVQSGTMLEPGAPAVIVDLPDVATGGPAALCRFISVYDGHEVRGITQVNLAGQPVTVRSTTWGAVKALYSH